MQHRKINLAGLGMAYLPKSKGKSLEVDTPDSMGYEITSALSSLEKHIGNVDEYVQNALGYKSIEALYKSLSAEQIDVVALNIYNIEQKRQGIIIADQTGIGKGRSAAAMIRYAINQGLKPIFITEKPNLFSDLYRDLVDIGCAKFRPLIMNGNEDKSDVKDKSGKVVYEAPTAKEQDAIFKSGKIPSRYDYLMLTYSQIDSKELTLKISFLQKVAQNNNIILDESHNASGTSNTGQRLQEIVRSARGVTFLSATFAKRPDNMALYAVKTCMNEANLSPEGLGISIARGGVALQEVVASQLVSQGQMVRRERTFEGIEVNYLTITERAEKDKEIADKITSILREVIAFQKAFIYPEIEEMDKAAKKAGKEIKKRTGTDKSGIATTPAFSKIFNVVNQMLFAIKADAVADRAIMRLKQGKKPVIAFSSTMGSFLEQLEDEDGNPVKDGSVISADFAAVMIKALDGVLRYTEIASNGDSLKKKFDISEFSEEAQQEYYRIVQHITNDSSGIVISPIDLIKQKLQKAGYKVAEVTGRKYEVILEEKKISNAAYEKIITIKDKGKSGSIPDIVKKFMPKFQQQIVNQSEEFEGVLQDLETQLSAIPKIYTTEKNLIKARKEISNIAKTGDVAIAQAHFFYRGTDWYVCEWDEQDQLYGYTILNGDRQNAEYGYMSLSELTQFRDKSGYGGIELDFYWTPQTVNQAIGNVNAGLNGKRKKKGLGEKMKDDSGVKTRIFGTMVKRNPENTNDAFRKFNNNEVDVLMINQSGSTGASAHAVPTDSVPANKVRQRVMIVLQAELDISIEVQKRGRINRTGQILLPIYDYITSAIPAEKRLMMMLQKKLKSLDANTSANQKNSEALIKSEDFLNKYGDKIVKTYLYENPEINDILGNPLKLYDSNANVKTAKDGTIIDAAHKVSGRVAVLSVKQQELFYRTILERYQDYVAMLIEEDKYDLEVEAQDLKARTVEKAFSKAGKGGSSPFGDNTYIEKCEVNVLRKPLTAAELEKSLKESLKGSTAQQLKTDTLKLFQETQIKQQNEEEIEIKKDYANRIASMENSSVYKKLLTEESKQKYLITRKAELIQAEKEAHDKMRAKYGNEYTFVKPFIEFFTIGKQLKCPDDFAENSDSTMAVCLGLKIDMRKPKPFSPGNIGLRIAIASSKRSVSFGSISGESTQRLLAIKGLSNDNSHMTESSMGNLLATWSKNIQQNSKTRDIRYILTGNLLQAFADEMPKGRLIQYSTQSGKQVKGVLLPESYNKKLKGIELNALKVSVPVGKTFPILQAMSVNIELKCTNSVVIMRDKKLNGYQVVTSSSKDKAGEIFVDREILEFVVGGNFEKTSQKMIASVEENKMQNVLDLLQTNHGVSCEISVFDFKKIEHLFQQNQFEDVVHKLPVVERPLIEKTGESEQEKRTRILKLKYKYILILQKQELELSA